MQTCKTRTGSKNIRAATRTSKSVSGYKSDQTPNSCELYILILNGSYSNFKLNNSDRLLTCVFMYKINYYRFPLMYDDHMVSYNG